MTFLGLIPTLCMVALRLSRDGHRLLLQPQQHIRQGSNPSIFSVSKRPSQNTPKSYHISEISLQLLGSQSLLYYLKCTSKFMQRSLAP